MKTTLAVILAFVLLAPAFSQSTIAVKKNASFANSQTDTTVAKKLGGVLLLSGVLTTTDSVKVDVYVQYSPNNSTWTTVLTDSLIYQSTSTGFAEYSIRDTDSDLLDGIAGFVRTILAFRASGNGVAGTTTYTYTYYFR